MGRIKRREGPDRTLSRSELHRKIIEEKMKDGYAPEGPQQLEDLSDEDQDGTTASPEETHTTEDITMKIPSIKFTVRGESFFSRYSGKKPFLTGAVGALLLGIGALLLGLYMVGFWKNESFTFSYSQIWLGISIVSYILMGLGCFMVGIGYLGYLINYDLPWALRTFLFTIITGSIWLFCAGFVIRSWTTLDWGNALFGWTFFMNMVFTAVIFFAQAVIVHKGKLYSVNKSISQITTGMSIVACVLICTLYLILIYGIAMYVVAVASFLMMVQFLSLDVFKKEEKTK